MAISDYFEPVSQLLIQGECSSHGVTSWMDYQSLGLSEINIPDRSHYNIWSGTG